jgi:hypothetical protein
MSITADVMRVGQVAAKVKSTKNDRTIHSTTVLKWIKRGVRLPDGTTLKLRATKRPGGWMIAPADLGEFLEVYAAAAAEEVSSPAPVGDRRRKELDLVDRRLEAAGLGMSTPVDDDD